MRRASIYFACLVLVVAADAQERADSARPPGVSEAALGRRARERGLPAALAGEWISQAVHHHRDGTRLVETGRVDCRWTLERSWMLCARRYAGPLGQQRLSTQLWTRHSGTRQVEVVTFTAHRAAGVTQRSSNVNDTAVVLEAVISLGGRRARTRSEWRVDDDRLVYRNETEEAVASWRVDFEERLERLPEQGLPAGTLAAADRDAVLAVTREYLDAWLANDSARVMATFLPNAVLPSGIAPVSGEQAIRAFWFPPEGPPTTVTAMEQEVTDVVGSGDRAIVTGRGTLTFQVGRDGKSRTQRSWFANVLTRQPGGRWLMARRIWVDLP